jgi:hypothetical protein
MYVLMEKYLISINRENDIIKYKKIIENVNNKFIEQIKIKPQEKIEYYLGDNFKKLNVPEYDQQTFLTPDVILNIINSHKTYGQSPRRYNEEECDVSNYKNTIELVFLNKGIFKLSDKDKKYYTENFEELLNTNAVNIKTNIANALTLSSMSKLIYSKDMDVLEKSKNKTFVSNYISTYKKLI